MVDYKFNWLGVDDGVYSLEVMIVVVLENCYDL